MKHVASNNLEAQLFGLTALVELVKRARHASTAQELAFVIVNESHALVPYRQAALWRRDAKGRGKIAAVSGSSAVERNAPFVLWLNRALAELDDKAEPGAAGPGAARAVAAADLDGALGEEWAEWLPAHGLWAPLMAGPDHKLGGLLLAREQPWTDGERHLVQELADGYAYAWALFLGGRRGSVLSWLWRRRGIAKFAVAAAALAALALPFPLSALAPAEVVALNPTIVRAPIDGVVDHFAIPPNAPVKEGQLLLELDPRAIQNKLDVAGKALAVAEAEYRQAAQSALFDDKSRSQLAVLKGRMDERQADLTYAKSLLDRVQVTASRSGIAVYDDPNDWVGRPVTIGERLLEIADPAQAELEVWLPVADAITLKPGAKIEFFLNVSPEAPLQASLRQASYEATMSPSNLLGYRLKASFEAPANAPRIGLRGTAKIYGERVSLFYYLARRPLASARQLLGF
jgi:hypothetical protein